MNRLSWLLYWADVLPQISTALCLASFLLFLPVGFLYLTGITNGFGEGTDDNPVLARFRGLWWAVILLPILWLSSFLVPDDKNTYYAIAASEIGEEILKTPEVGKARKALDNWLNKQLDDGKSEKPPKTSLEE